MDLRLKSQLLEGVPYPPHFVTDADDLLKLTWKLREKILVDIHLEQFFEMNPQHKNPSPDVMLVLRGQMREHLRAKGIL